MNLLSRRLLTFFLIGCLAHSVAFPQQTPNASTSEYWTGWFEDETEQVRWIVELKKEPSGTTNGTVHIPELMNSPVAVQKLRTKSDDWGFEWTVPGGKETLSFFGRQESAEQVAGILVVGDKMPILRLRRSDAIPKETADDLGADIVWTDQTPNVGPTGLRKFDKRFRIYSKPPFAEGEPRVVFDSLANNLLGKPVNFSVQGTKFLFSIPALEAEYQAEIKDTNYMLGTFSVKGKTEALALMRLGADKEDAKKTSPAETTATKPANQDASKINKNASNPSEEAVQIKMKESPKAAPRQLAPNESAFLLTVGDKATRRKELSKIHTLGYTLTLPDQSKNKKVPCAILFSTFGLQDRDGKVGTNAHYRDLAQALAKVGIASIRYDDRGIGESSDVDDDFSLQEMINDGLAVVNRAQELEEVDPTKILLIGHGEGATIATALASQVSGVACQVLIAPQGVSGSQLLISQGINLADMQGMSVPARNVLADLQREVHNLARFQTASNPNDRLQIEKLVQKYWPQLSVTVDEPKTPQELVDMKKNLENQLMTDLTQLYSKINRQFLDFDPSTDWMLMRSPTLVVWGTKDCQVLTAINKPPMENAASRSSNADIQNVMLEGLNHWLQRANTGLPFEYETAGGLDPAAMRTITDWVSRRMK